jgi:hypothetical protein
MLSDEHRQQRTFKLTRFFLKFNSQSRLLPVPHTITRFVLFSMLAFSACMKLGAQVTLTSSDIPIMVISTNSQTIVDEPKIMADMGIIYNGPGNRNYMTDPFNNYNGKIGIEIRGASSQQYHPKKSYGLETWDAAGNSIDIPLLGMPAENDWCLIANYIDKSLINNSLTYYTWQQMGWYGSRHQHVELVIDGQYQGVYLLVEKIKRDSQRVNISKLQNADIAGDQLTGGYIVAIDLLAGSGCQGWISDYDACGANGAGVYPEFKVIYPDFDSLQPAQFAYIHSYVDSFETAINTQQFDPLTGWQKFADINSFVDFFLMQEFAKNVDGYRASTYFYKDRNSNGGKLTMGLVWDYDRGWDNASYATGYMPNGWCYPFGDNYSIPNPLQVPKWWENLLLDSHFTKALRCRWEQLKFTTLGISTLQAYADSLGAYLNESQGRNFTQWPILGQVIFPNPSPAPATYQGEIDELKNWISARWMWLDANIPGAAVNCNFVGVSETNSVYDLTIFPNPGTDDVTLSWSSGAEVHQIVLLNSLGETVSNFSVSVNTVHLDVSDLLPGLYFILADTEKRKLIVE